jgi:hypothetical protein
MRKMQENTIEVGLKYKRGAVETATVDLCEVEEAALGWDFRAWINIAGMTVEFLQGAIGDIRSYYPFEEHDTYREAGRVYAREAIKSFAEWQKFVEEYAANLDPRDVFKARRAEGL